MFMVSITGSSEDDKNFFENILSPLLKNFTNKPINIKTRRDCFAIDILLYNKELFDRINSFGFPIGKKGPNIRIPKYFYNKNLIIYLVAGFMATDGSFVLTKNPNKYYPRIEGNGISKKLIKQIHEYLTKIGMEGHFYLAKRKNINSSYNCQQQYRFQFNGLKNLLLFQKVIGFANPKYEEKFINFIKYESEYKRKIKGIPSQEQGFVR